MEANTNTAKKLKERIVKNADVLIRLLQSDTLLHPQHCNCATKSRDIKHHMRTCPYRAYVDFLNVLKKGVKKIK